MKSNNDPFQLDKPVEYKTSIGLKIVAFVLIIIISAIPLFDIVPGFEANNGFTYFIDCLGNVTY